GWRWAGKGRRARSADPLAAGVVATRDLAARSRQPPDRPPSPPATRPRPPLPEPPLPPVRRQMSSYGPSPSAFQPSEPRQRRPPKPHPRLHGLRKNRDPM